MRTNNRSIALDTETFNFIKERVNPVLEKEKDVFHKKLALEMVVAIEPTNADKFELASIVKTLAHTESLGWSLALLSHLCLSTPVLKSTAKKGWQADVLKEVEKGQALLAWAVTEPKTGSDIAAAAPGVIKKDGKLTLKVHKRYITNGSSADYIILYTTDSEQTPYLLLVDARQNKVNRERIITNGFRSGDTSSVDIDGLKLKEENILASGVEAVQLLYESLERERLYAGLAVNEISNIVLKKTRDYMKSTVRNNQLVFDKQAIYHQYAALRSELLAADALANQALNSYIAGQRISLESTAIKIVCFELAQKIINAGCQWIGAVAFEADHWLARLRNDSQAFTLAAGTTEIMKELIHYFDKKSLN